MAGDHANLLCIVPILVHVLPESKCKYSYIIKKKKKNNIITMLIFSVLFQF